MHSIRPNPRPVLALTALLPLACVMTDSRTPAERHIVPLAVGNTWTYVDSIFHDGVFAGEDSARTVITEKRVLTLAGEPRTVHLSRSADPVTGEESSTALYVQNLPDGNHTVGIARDTVEFLFPSLHVQFPTETGNRYPVHFLELREEDGELVPFVDTLETEVADARASCETPAGNFECIEYRARRPGGVLHARAWYAPGVGFVESETVRTQNVGGSEREVTRTRKLRTYMLR